MEHATPDGGPARSAPQSTKPRPIEALYAPPPPPTWENYLVVGLYGVTAVTCPLAGLLGTRPTGWFAMSGIWYAWFFGGGALHAAWFAWGAWRVRPRPERPRIPAWAFLPLFAHALCGVGIGAALLWTELGGEMLKDTGAVVAVAALGAVLLGWLPALVLRPFARSVGVLAGASAFGLLWLVTLMTA
jgi:hypothetical protein